MKILYLTPGVFDKGGISRYNRFQIQALREILGPENVTVLSLLGPKRTKNDLESDFETDWHGNSNSWVKFQILRYSAMATYYALKYKPDVIWSGHLNFSALTYALATLIRAISLCQVYGKEVWTPRPSRPDIAWGFSKVNYILSDCHFSAEFIKQHDTSRKNIPVFWDCVDSNLFIPGEPSPAILAKYNLPDPKTNFNIMTLGRIIKICDYKGYSRLLSLFTKVDKHANLIFGGSGDFVGELKKMAQDLGISDRVYFPGFIHDDDLPDFYRAASVFCLVGDRGPGRGEGIPLTPLEAAACGIPILVGNQDGSREAVKQGINGYALDPFNLDDISNCLKKLANDNDHRLMLGSAARKRIMQFHSYEYFKIKTQEFIQELEETLRRSR